MGAGGKEKGKTKQKLNTTTSATTTIAAVMYMDLGHQKQIYQESKKKIQKKKNSMKIVKSVRERELVLWRGGKKTNFEIHNTSSDFIANTKTQISFCCSIKKTCPDTFQKKNSFFFCFAFILMSCFTFILLVKNYVEHKETKKERQKESNTELKYLKTFCTHLLQGVKRK